MFADRRAMVFWGALGAALLASRLAHVNILWADEDYHLAAAIQMLRGKLLYRDLWYDKPPLAAVLALLFGGWPGWPLRAGSTLVALACCALGYKLAASIWGRREGYCAAALLGFFQIFYLAPAIMPFEPDTLMIAPHAAAVWLAWRKRLFWAGVAGGIAFLLSPKGLLVLAVGAMWGGAGSLSKIAPGFAIPSLLAYAWLASAGALTAYSEQVWRWGSLYVSAQGSDPQAQRGALAILNWLGFHAALAAGAAWCWWKDREAPRRQMAAWAILALASTAIGGRFAPRYFDALLLALAIPASRGVAMLAGRTGAMVALAALLAVPAVRFGPRYFTLAIDNLRGRPHEWLDIAMDQENRRAAEWLRQSGASATVFVWGYRPGVVAYSRLPVASRLWDSQAVTGVPADRHLSDSRPVAGEWAGQNRAELVATKPDFIVDGLSAYNPELGIRKYSDLEEWFAGYCEAFRTGGTTIYRKCEPR